MTRMNQMIARALVLATEAEPMLVRRRRGQPAPVPMLLTHAVSRAMAEHQSRWRDQVSFLESARFIRLRVEAAIALRQRQVKRRRTPAVDLPELEELEPPTRELRAAAVTATIRTQIDRVLDRPGHGPIARAPRRIVCQTTGCEHPVSAHIRREWVRSGIAARPGVPSEGIARTLRDWFVKCSITGCACQTFSAR